MHVCCARLSTRQEDEPDARACSVCANEGSRAMLAILFKTTARHNHDCFGEIRRQTSSFRSRVLPKYHRRQAFSHAVVTSTLRTLATAGATRSRDREEDEKRLRTALPRRHTRNCMRRCSRDELPWLAVIALQIVTAGAAWVTLGATLGRGARRLGHPDLITRAGAINARRRDRPDLASIVLERVSADGDRREKRRGAIYCAPDPPCTIFSFSFRSTVSTVRSISALGAPS